MIDDVVPPHSGEPAVEPEFPGSAQALDEVIVTAVLTAAVVPFVQEIVKKVAEDSYSAARSLLRQTYRKAAARNGGTPTTANTLLIVRDDQPGTNAVLYARPDMNDATIRALAELDLDGVVATGRKAKKVQIFWDEATGRWQTVTK